MTAHKNIAFSAPGKALLAGGYLVLDPEFRALSIALSARMHASIEANVEDQETLVVRSPQFLSEWRYNTADGEVVGEVPHANPFVNAAVRTCRKYFQKPLKAAQISVYSDDGFHSQVKSEAVEGFPRFKNHNRAITEVPKTGLGSSAALCTVVTAALVSLNGPQVGEPRFLELVHNLAQTAHCYAQGKVGSGFDVATAVYGSIQYSRFQPKDVPDESCSDATFTSEIEKTWSHLQEPCALPENIELLMGDVAGGSSTPGMVKKVLEWVSKDPDSARKLYRMLNTENICLMDTLQKASGTSELSSDLAAKISSHIQHMRKCIKQISSQANVDIEPMEQTTRIDMASEIDGVLGGVVPGAGGNDAICLLVETAKLDSARVQLQNIQALKEVKWLNLRREAQGLRSEDPSAYPA